LTDRPFSVGDRVLVAGPAGQVIGEVLQVATPAEMPPIEGAPPPEDVRSILREWRVDLILLIGHRYDDQQVCFFAFHNPDGWTDLHGQKLTVLKGYAVGLPLTTEN
jgi:hypothetical protein